MSSMPMRVASWKGYDLMMGTKERCFAPLVNVSLEELVPADHFYRRLGSTLDFSFIGLWGTTERRVL